MSNPVITNEPVTPGEALRALAENLLHPHRHFRPEEISFPQAVEAAGVNLAGYRQTTGVYLLGLAASRGGKLATPDQAIKGMLPESASVRVGLELIGR